MSSRKEWLIDLLTEVTGDKLKSEVILELLQAEGVVVLGYGDKEIEQVVEKFAATFGTTKTSKYDRWAASRLVGKYGSQAVVGIIGLLGEKSRGQYAPVVNNITQLEDKWPSVLNYLRTEDGEEIVT